MQGPGASAVGEREEDGRKPSLLPQASGDWAPDPRPLHDTRGQEARPLGPWLPHLWNETRGHFMESSLESREALRRPRRPPV